MVPKPRGNADLIFWYAFFVCVMVGMFDIWLLVVSLSRGNTLRLSNGGIWLGIGRIALIPISVLLPRAAGVAALGLYALLFGDFVLAHTD